MPALYNHNFDLYSFRFYQFSLEIHKKFSSQGFIIITPSLVVIMML